MSRQAEVFINFDQPIPAARLYERLIDQQPTNLKYNVWEYSLTALYFKNGEITKLKIDLHNL